MVRNELHFRPGEVRREKAQRNPEEVREVFKLLNDISGISVPKNYTEKHLLALSLQAASPDNPFTVYVGSCPDYFHNGEVYTHEGLGEGVPLLTQRHIEVDSKVLQVLEQCAVPYAYIVMVADVEATDDVFRSQFTNGSEEEFLRRCTASVEATGQLLAEKMHPVQGKVRSSSFFREFGRDSFMRVQQAYQAALSARYETDSSFRTRVAGDIYARRSLYQTMYKSVYFKPGDHTDFLVARTIRTMAQYLTLGRFIASSAENPAIINHPTRNLGMFNDRNKYKLPGDAIQPHPTIPVFTLDAHIY